MAADGTVAGVCEGTGIQAAAADYAARGQEYLLSAPGGVGAVLRAAVAMQQLNDALSGGVQA